jgi:hypothetical protein
MYRISKVFTNKRLWNTRKERKMERLIITIIGTMLIVIAYLIGLNQNRKEKEYYKKEYQYYSNKYFNLRRKNIDGK